MDLNTTPGLTPDEVQALAYQAQLRHRAANDNARRAALMGNPQAKLDFDYRWAPLQAWLAQNRES